MTLAARIALLVTTVLVLDTALILVISRDRARDAFEGQARDLLRTELLRVETEIRATARALETWIGSVAADTVLTGRLEEAARESGERESNLVVYSADRRRDPAQADLLRVLDARGRVLTSSPDVERFGTPDRALAALATLPGDPAVREVAYGDSSAVMLLAVRRTPGGLALVAGRRLDAGFAAGLSRDPGARIFLRRPATAWSRLGGATPSVPADADTTPGEELTLIEGDTLTCGLAPILDGELELLAVRSDATLARLEGHLTRSALLVGGLTLAASLLLAFLLARRIARPLETLTHATRRVASGDWSDGVPERGGASEFRTLVRAFNTMQSDLARQRDALARAERASAWQDAARRVAHEIKNSLTPLQLAWERLREGPAPERVAESTDAIAREVQNLRRLVGEFSELGHWPEPERRRVDLSGIAQQTAGIYGSRVTTVLADAGVAIVRADPGQLARALANLVQNALDATHGDGKVTIRTWRDARGVALAVADEGTGMDEATRAKAFTPYFTSKDGGTGLGLSIVERIASSNGATLDLVTRPSEGTTITLRFTGEREESDDG